VADQKHKTPEELGEAVGKKIEELFGGMFADEESPQPKEQLKAVADAPVSPKPPSAPQPASEPDSPAMPKPASAPPKPQVAAPPPAAKRVSPPKPPPVEVQARPPVSPQKEPDGFDQIMERIEILILNLEWEVSPESVKEISDKLGLLEPLLPAGGPARTIISMNLRVLPRFNTPDAIPHRSLLKLLQDSVSALKLVHSSHGKQAPGQTLISAITNSYKEIVSSTTTGETSVVTTALVSKETQTPYASLVHDIGTVAHSLEEISQRLARILGVLRQGGNMSPEEITRRLGTLEHLFSERVGQLSSCHKEMTELQLPAEGLAEISSSSSEKSGLLLMNWAGMYLAIPFSMISEVYRLSKTQAGTFVNAAAIRMGDDVILRLPLKKPDNATIGIPEWMVRFSSGGRREFFILPDRLLGYRLAPQGVNVGKQARIKIGSISYAVINQAVLR